MKNKYLCKTVKKNVFKIKTVTASHILRVLCLNIEKVMNKCELEL